jgi:hypothetical protein
VVLDVADALPWLRNDGLLKVFHPPFLHWAFEVGGATRTTWLTPLTMTFETSTVPWTSIRIEIPDGEAFAVALPRLRQLG